jgi:hypothetical protein
VSLFGEASIEAARQARRELIADMRLHELADDGQVGAYNHKLIVAMFKAAEQALDLDELVETATRAVAGDDWAQMSPGVRDGIRRDARIAFAAIGLGMP